MNAAERQYLTRALHALSAAGWQPYAHTATDDASYTRIPHADRTAATVIAAVESVDECHVLLRRDAERAAMLCVPQGPGNPGDEVIVDYSARLSDVLAAL